VKPKRLRSRRFTFADQQWFGSLSGDVNPLHLDPVAARRMLFGDVVVHGMHTALWALEAYLASLSERPGIVSLRASFLKPTLLEQEMSVLRVTQDGQGAQLEVVGGAATFVTLELKTQAARMATTTAVLAPAPAITGVPRNRRFDELAGLQGDVPVFFDAELATRGLPYALAAVGPEFFAFLLGLTRLVGMECPGTQSLFSSFEVSRAPAGSAESTEAGGSGVLHYQVERAAVVAAPVRIAVLAPGLRGSVSAFFRPAPAAQPELAEVAPLVGPGELAGQWALVVGGSRGLGETTAKIIACGGGHPVITYLTGETDARRVADEIKRSGRTCDLLRLDVLHLAWALAELRRRKLSITHLYFFATPRIAGVRRAPYQPERLREFMAYYVDGFYNLCAALAHTSPGLKAFYPSTIFIERGSRENPEYVIAKSAAEALCQHLNDAQSGFSVLCRRLPRVATDQTSGLLKLPVSETLAVMLPIVRAMAASEPANQTAVSRESNGEGRSS
jgi:acyl dehydratase/NAD(P)-dependent dehydrogenase (short-subunit alcohol dehydrogenase family)